MAQSISNKVLSAYLTSPVTFQGFFNSLSEVKQFKLEAQAGFPRYESNYSTLLADRKAELELLPNAPLWLTVYLGLKESIGIGKPSLRLEFSSNQELLEWSKVHQIDTIQPASKSGKAFKAAIKVDEPREPEPEQAPEPELKNLVKWVPLKDIHEAKQLFQNRQDDFSKESVKRILKAVDQGTFKWESLDPIILWLNPIDGKLYILSGHSRTQAFRELAKHKAKVDGRLFTSIPAKITRVSLEEAKEIALNSNTLSTKETELERANYYRGKRIAGTSKKDLEAEVRDKEGKNAVYILNLSYLNPNGSTVLGLLQMAEAEDVTNKQIIQTLADWIGEARRKFEDLNNSHEEEIYKWLFGGAYGTGPSKLSSKVAFMQRITDLMQRRLLEPKEAPLNIENRIVKNPLQADYDRELEAAENEVRQAEKTVTDKRRYLVGGGASPEAIERAMQMSELELQAAIRRLEQLKANKGKVRDAVRNQPSLFGLEPEPEKFIDFIYRSLDNQSLETEFNIIPISKIASEKILDKTGLNVSGFKFSITSSEVRHISKHLDPDKDPNYFTKSELELLPEILKTAPKTIELFTKQRERKIKLIYPYDLVIEILVATVFSESKNKLRIRTFYKKERA